MSYRDEVTAINPGNWVIGRGAAAEIAARADARIAGLVEALKSTREYVACALADEREKFSGYIPNSNVAQIEADLAQIDAVLAKAGAA